jgi:hypothetical protein
MVDFYGDAAGFRAYQEARNRNVAQWDDDAEIEGALLIASEWLDGKFRASFGGDKVAQRDQVREWPRNGAVDRDGYGIDAGSVPNEAVHSTYEAALRELQSPGSLLIDWTPNVFKRASVDGAVSVEWATFGSANDVQTQFAVIERIMDPILTGGTNGDVSALSGAVTRV